MKEYLFLFREDDGNIAQHSPENWQAHMQKWMQWMGGLQEKGQLVGAQPLDGSGRQITGPKKVITDGPFMEGKEVVAGYLLCKANDYNEAVRIAEGCPILEFDNGKVEVREIKELKIG